MTEAKSDLILERMMSLHPKIIDLTLDRVWRLLEKLDHPEARLPPVIHVAGTNGKGSTLAMLRAGIEGAGQTAHVYTSPHLVRFHERVRVAGELISEPDLSAVLDECLEVNGSDPITYFEITTVAAILAFSRVKADWTLLETGLGGRLDATNVVKVPAMTIITPVDLDHQQYLGDTLPAIAFEKAGIMKAGVPCVIGAQHPEALEVMEDHAERVKTPLNVQGRDWLVWEERDRMVFQDQRGLLDLPRPILRGEHQIGNAGNALAALRAVGFGPGACEAAMTGATWPGRMQKIAQGRLADLAGSAELWLDGGHNPAAGHAVASALADMPARPLHLICGMLGTKDVTGFMRPFKDAARSLHAVAIPGETATLSSEETASAARKVGIRTVSVADGVDAAIQEIVAEAPEARILICGSLYLAGHVLRENG